MPFLKINPPDISGQQKTSLGAAVAAAGTALTVRDTVGFVALDYVVLGTPGADQAELKQLSTIGSLTAMTSAAADFAHVINTLITKSDYNQIKIYRATSQTGSYSVIATVNIQWDRGHTPYNDTAGSASSWYKFTYYNAQTATESSLSDAIAATGSAYGSVGWAIDLIRLFVGKTLTGPITDTEMLSLLNTAQANLANNHRFPQLETNSTAASLTINTASYALPSDYKRGTIAQLKITISSVDYFPTYISWLRYGILARTATTSSYPNYFTIWGANYYVYPTPSATVSSAQVVSYTKNPTTLDSQGDSLEIPNPIVVVYDVSKLLDGILNDGRRNEYFSRLYNEALSGALATTAIRQSVHNEQIDDDLIDANTDPFDYVEIS